MKYRVRQGYVVHQGVRVILPGEVFVPSPEVLETQAWKIEPVTDGGKVDNYNLQIESPSIPVGGAWQGRRCFIVGGGPSLVGFDFDCLKGKLVIGINRAFEKFDPTVIFSMDSRFYTWLTSGALGGQALEKFERSQARKIWVDTHGFKYGPEILTVPHLPGAGVGRSLTGGIYGGSNSGFAALNLAVCLGANTIYLLGFDLISQGGFQRWFHDGYPEVQRDSVFDTFRQDFEKAALELQQRGIRVINLNPDSGLKCFEFGKMPESVADVEDKVTVITPTGDRPEALALLRRWMATQTRQPDQWLIIDDGKKRVKKEEFPGATVIRRRPRTDDPPCTLGENLKAAVPLVAHDKVLVMEDDDWYGPAYIETMAVLLDAHEVVGISGTNYYHPGIPGFREMGRGDHASLSQTGIRKSALPELLRAIPGDGVLPDCSVDLRLWKNCNGNGHLITGEGLKLHCSIKGMPGRPGAGVGHDKRFYTVDPDLIKFNEWCGDVEAYRGFIKG